MTLKTLIIFVLKASILLNVFAIGLKASVNDTTYMGQEVHSRVCTSILLFTSLTKMPKHTPAGLVKSSRPKPSGNLLHAADCKVRSLPGEMSSPPKEST